MNQPAIADEDARIDDAILQYLEAAESGTPIAEETWLSLHPQEIQAALRAFLANRAIVAKASDMFAPSTTQIEPFGFYCDFAFLAEGGMGTIFRCKDSRLERPIAMKVLHQRLMAIADMPVRFREEAQVAGQLQHPNIAPVHELGELSDGRPYFTMKLVEGATFSVSIRDYHTSKSDERFEKLLRDFVSVCEGVEYAHSRGVLHRDLKPANIMVGRFGEVLVMDWGLTKVLASSKEVSEPGIHTARGDDPHGESQPGVRGTPAFMAPEQASDSGELDARCDVFALGAILCQILTGRSVYVSDQPGIRELIEMARRGATTAAFLRLDASGAPRELIDLAKKCLSLHPNSRPATAKEVGDAVTRYQASAQKRAQEAEVRTARAEALAQRRKWQLALASAVVLAMFGTFLGWRWVTQQKDERRNKATREVLVAITKGEGLRDTIRRLPGETVEDNVAALAGWKEGLATVEPAVALARSNDIESATLVAVVDLHADFEKQAQATEARVHELQRQRKVVAAVRRAVELSSVVNLLNLSFDTGPSIAAFAAAFRELDLDLLSDDPAKVADRFGMETETVRMTAVEGINVWWVIDKESRSKLSAVLDRVDGDPPRRKFREAVEQGDVEGFKQFARTPGLLNRHAEFVGYVLPHVGGAAESLALLKRAVFKTPNDFGLQMALGLNYQRNGGTYREAAASFLAAIALSPSSSMAYESLGIAQKMAGQLAEAEVSFNRAFELDNQNVRALCNLGWIRLIQLNYVEMDRLGKQALAIRPDYAEALSLRAISLAYRARTVEAVELLAQIPEDSRNYFAPLFAKFTVQYHTTRFQEATATARELATRFADSDFSWFFTAFAALLEGDTIAVEEAARAAVQRHSDGLFGSISRFMLISALVFQGRLAEAEEAARGVVRELGADNSTAQLLLYEVLERQGRFAEASAIGDRLKDFSQGPFGLLTKLRRAMLNSWLGQERVIENIVSGKYSPPTGAAFDVAYVALLKRRPALALLIYRRSLDSTLGLLVAGGRVSIGDDEGLTQRVCAARAAGMLAGGVGLDAAGATEDERRTARADALKWLKAEFKSQRPATAHPRSIPAIRRLFIYFKTCPDLAAVRDANALAKLPEAEQKQWREFWTELDEMLKKFKTPVPPKPISFQ